MPADPVEVGDCRRPCLDHRFVDLVEWQTLNRWPIARLDEYPHIWEPFMRQSFLVGLPVELNISNPAILSSSVQWVKLLRHSLQI